METMENKVITPEVEKVLTPEVVQFVKTETFQISRELDGLEVKTQEDDKRAVILGLANKSAINRLESFRKAIVGPLNDHVANINSIFKKISAPFLNNDQVIKQKRDIFIREQERIARIESERLETQRRKEQAILDEQRRKEQEKLDKKALKTGVEAPVLAPVTILPPVPKVEVPKTTHTELGFSTVKKVMKFKVLNPDLVPREYCIPDEKKIGVLVRAKVLKELPGIGIWEENSQTF